MYVVCLCIFEMAMFLCDRSMPINLLFEQVLLIGTFSPYVGIVVNTEK